MVFAISIFLSCLGIADENSMIYCDTETYNMSIDDSNLLIITGEIDMLTPYNEMQLEMKNSNYSLPTLADISKVTDIDYNLKDYTIDNDASKDRYITYLLELEEYKNYSREELETTFMSYDELSAKLIDDETIFNQKTSVSTAISENEDMISFKFSSSNKVAASKSTISTKAVVPNVVITAADCDWSWVQNETAANTITIHNYGTTTADGIVVVYSVDENKGWMRTYSDLDPGDEIDVSVPFYVDINEYPTVGAKSIRLLAYVESNSLYYMTSAPTVSSIMVEMYNNNDGYLVDPDNGYSLQLDDLNHHSSYVIASKAAVAADNTSTPEQTAYLMINSIDDDMIYDTNILSPLETGADTWIIANSYHGICDEYAVLTSSYMRALGVPTRRICMFINNDTSAHQFNEFWNGNNWIHIDSSGPKYSTPRYYADILQWDISNIGLAFDADDSKNATDGVDGDGILSSFLDMTIAGSQDLTNRYC